MLQKNSQNAEPHPTTHPQLFILTGPQMFTNRPSCARVEYTNMPQLPNRDEELKRLQSEIVSQKKSTGELLNSISMYMKHSDELRSTINHLNQTLKKLQLEKDSLSRELRKKEATIEELRKITSKGEGMQEAIATMGTVVNITELDGRDSVSEESIKQLSSLIDSNVELVGRMEQEYATLKDRYEAVLAHTTMQSEDDAPLASAETTSLRRKLTEAIIRLNQAEQNEHSVAL